MGAPLLPVGLYTEVSSNALSAGQGAAASAPASAMDAFSQVLANLSGDGEAGAEALGSAAVDPLSVSAKAKLAASPVANGGLPDFSSLTEVTSGAEIQLPVLGGVELDDVPLDADAAAPVLTDQPETANSAEFELPVQDADDTDSVTGDLGTEEALAMVQPVPVSPSPVQFAAEIGLGAEARLDGGAVDADGELLPAAPAQAGAPGSDAGEETLAGKPQVGVPVLPQAEVQGGQQAPVSPVPVQQSGVSQSPVSDISAQQVAAVASALNGPELSAGVSVDASQFSGLASDASQVDASVESLIPAGKSQAPGQTATGAPASADLSEGEAVISSSSVKGGAQADVKTAAPEKVEGLPAQAQAVGLRDLPPANAATAKAAAQASAPVAAGLDLDQAVAVGVRDRMSGVVPAAEASNGNSQTATTETVTAASDVAADESVVIVPAKAPGKRWMSELPEIARSAQPIQSQSQAPSVQQAVPAEPVLQQSQAPVGIVKDGISQPSPTLVANGDGGNSLLAGEKAQSISGLNTSGAEEGVVASVKASSQAASSASMVQTAAGAQVSKPGQGAQKTGDASSAAAQPVIGEVTDEADRVVSTVSSADPVAAEGDVTAALPLKPPAVAEGANVPGTPVTAGTQKSDAAAKSEAASPVAMATAGAAVLSEDDGTSDTDGLTMDGEFAAQVRTTNQHLARMDAATAQAQTQAQSQSQTGQAASQIASAMARTLNNGDTKFQMRLDPPELGRVEVHMKVAKDGSVQAHMIVDSPETLDMFMRDQRGLERALANAGLNTDSSSLQFSLRDDGNQGFASSQDNGSGNGRSDRSQSSLRDVDDVSSEQAAGVYAARNQSGLDIRI